MATEPYGRVAILTPGPLNETYFEHAYIARYLGIMLLEGEDLTVTDGRLMVRTVSGLKPISVLWRRLDAAFADPLELRSDSQIGTPGLVEAIRRGSVTIGQRARLRHSRDARASRLPAEDFARAARRGTAAADRSPPGGAARQTEREHVIDNFDRMMIGPALVDAAALRGRQRPTVLGSTLSADERAGPARAHRGRWRRLRRPGGGDAVDDAGLCRRQAGAAAGEPARLSGAHAATAGWSCRAALPASATRSTPTAIAMQRGGQAADVWVVSRQPVKQETLLPRERDVFKRNVPGSLPSRAAENLTWLGRYIERSEDTVRILRAYHVRLAETVRSGHAAAGRYHATISNRFGIDTKIAIPPGLISNLDSAVYSAGQIRDRFSPDGWLALSDLSKTIHQFRRQRRARRRRHACHDRPAAQARRLFRPAAREHVPLHRLALPAKSAAGWSAASRSRARSAG